MDRDSMIQGNETRLCLHASSHDRALLDLVRGLCLAAKGLALARLLSFQTVVLPVFYEIER